MEVFCSYARDDEDGLPLLLEFFEDLCREVRGRLGLVIADKSKKCIEQADPVVFVDQAGIKLGQPWPSRLSYALNSCKVMVSLYSPSYFQRFYCGKEFAYFLERQKYHRTRHPELKDDPVAILPILWRPCEEFIPKDIKVRNYLQYGQSEEYKNYGLINLVRIKANQDAYIKFLGNLAERIIEAAKQNIEPLPQPPDIESVTDVFSKASDQAGKSLAAASGPSREGPNTVRFVYVVGTRQELDRFKIRSMLATYADQIRPLWAPYPPPENAIGVLVAGLAAGNKRMFPDMLEPDSGLIDKLRQAKKTNSPVVLVKLDVQAPGINQQDLMRDYDDTNFLNCAALVIWDQSEETRRREADLRKLVEDVFDDNRKTRIPRLFIPKISSLDDLLANIDSVLETLRANVVTTGEPMNPLPPGGREIPQIRNG